MSSRPRQIHHFRQLGPARTGAQRLERSRGGIPGRGQTVLFNSKLQRIDRGIGLRANQVKPDHATWLWSDTWQLVINTLSNIIAMLMLFLIQNTQNRESAVGRTPPVGKWRAECVY